MKRNLLYNPGAGDQGGGGGGNGNPPPNPPAASWRDSLPEDMRSAPSLATINDIPTLAKSFLSAQTMLGSRVAIPGKDAKPEEIQAFYGKLGRPEAPDKYSMPDYKLPEGLKVDDAKLGSARALFHQLNLSDTQAKGVLEYYFKSIGESHTAEQTRLETSRNDAMAKLQKDYGDALPAKVDLAKAVLQKFGGQELLKYMDMSEKGNDPHLIGLLAKVGEAMLEDGSAGSGGGLLIQDETAAKAEIDKLKMDGEFMKQLFSTVDPGHGAAVKKWTELHAKAFPGKQKE